MMGRYVYAAVIATAIVGVLLAVWRLVVRHVARSARLKRLAPNHGRVGGFNVSVAGARYEGPNYQGDRRSAFGFTDPRDATLATTVGIVAVVAHGSSRPASACIAIDEFLGSVGRMASTRAAVVEILRDSLVQVSDRAASVAAAAQLERLSDVALAAVAVTSTGLFWVSAGDVRIYLVRARAAHQVNRDRTSGLGRDGPPGSPTRRAIDIAPAPLPLRVDDAIVVCTPVPHAWLSEARVAETVVRHRSGSSRAFVSRVAALDRNSVADVSVVHLGIRPRRF